MTDDGSREQEWTITDKDGQEYTMRELISPQSFVLRLYNNYSQLVGIAKCTMRQQELVIGDIRVQEELTLPPNNLLEHLWRRVMKQPKTVNYQSRGLGSKMLERIITFAQEEQFNRISGWISEVDAGHAHALFKWYRRYGFTVVLSTPGKALKIATIELDLRTADPH